jgi:hypothetical protein
VRYLILASVALGFCSGQAWSADDRDLAVGTWALQANTGAGEKKFILTVSKAGKDYKTTMTGDDDAKVSLKDFQVKDGVVRFKTEGKYMDAPVSTKWEGKIKGDDIKGTADYEYEGMSGSIDFEGKRQKDKK